MITKETPMPATRIPDLRGTPLGRTDTRAHATAVILKRVTSRTRDEAPPSGFQSSI